jgi:hypothetical protein
VPGTNASSAASSAVQRTTQRSRFVQCCETLHTGRQCGQPCGAHPADTTRTSRFNNSTLGHLWHVQLGRDLLTLLKFLCNCRLLVVPKFGQFVKLHQHQNAPLEELKFYSTVNTSIEPCLDVFCRCQSVRSGFLKLSCMNYTVIFFGRISFKNGQSRAVQFPPSILVENRPNSSEIRPSVVFLVHRFGKIPASFGVSSAKSGGGN